MLKCFISHSSSDRPWVESSLIPVVKQAGLEPWYGPASIETASDWERSILQGLVTSDWFAVILSPHSIASRWVKIEVHWALEHRNGRVLPILIERCNPTELHIGLSLIQYIDVRPGVSNGMEDLSKYLQKAGRSEQDAEPFRYLPPPPQESVLIKQIRDEAILARVMEASFDFLIFSGTFGPVEPGEVALVVLGNRSLWIRVDFDPAGVTLHVDGYRSFEAPLTPSAMALASETRQWTYIIDLEPLRQVDPTHSLARLTPRDLDDVPVQLLMTDRAVQRLSKLEKTSLLTLAVAGEVSGYLLGIMRGNLFVRGDELENIRFPIPIPGKPGFSSLILPEWKTRLELETSAVTTSLRDVSRSVDHLQRPEHIECWRNIWPDIKTHQYFHQTHKVPMDENTLIFHPWNQHFVRLRKEVEESSGCGVPGIGAFQLGGASAFYVFSTVRHAGRSKGSFTVTRDGVSLRVGTNETVAILNIVRQLALLNYTWVKEVEGNHIQGLCVLLPTRRRYVILSSKLYHEHNLRRPVTEGSEFDSVAQDALEASVTMVKPLP